MSDEAKPDTETEAAPGGAPESLAFLTPETTRGILLDLRAHQIELEAQNEALRRTQAELWTKNFVFDAALTANSIADLHGFITEANAAFLKTWGYPSKAEVIGKPITDFLQNPHEATAIVAILEATGHWEGDYVALKRDGSTFIANGMATMVRDAQGTLIGYQSAVLDVTRHKRMENVMTFLAQTSSGTAEEPFFLALARFLGKSLDVDFVCVDRLEGDGLTARTVAIWHNGQFEDNMSYALKDTPCGAAVGQMVCCFPAKVCELFPHDPMLRELQAESYAGVTLWSHSCQPIGLIAVIGRSVLADRALTEAILKLVAVRAAGEMEHLQAEEAVQASLREKDSLLKEIHHRVKNNLQIISSLLRLQSGRIDSPAAHAALQDMQHRVRSMALIHEHLYRAENFAAVDLATYLRQLCQQLLRALVTRPGTIQLHLDLAPIHLGIDQAIPCGLLVNELVSNALEHAFPQGRGGEVRVELQALTDTPGWRLRVADNGVGLPANYTHDPTISLGMQLVSDLTRQLGGRLVIGAGPGAVFEVMVPH